jgi:uncharacterized RDD family membrane protein YckC
MYCSKCGTNIADGTVFCSACGQPTSSPAAVGAAPASPSIPGGSLPAYPVARSVAPYGARAQGGIPHAPYAGFWLRLVAYLIDNVLLGVLFGICVLLVVAVVGVGYFRAIFENLNGENVEFPFALVSMILFACVLSLVVSWIYHAWMESSSYEATFGKMALGLTVTDMEGRKISFARASGRFFAKIITGLIPLGIGYIMAGFTEKKQALHDMIANCLVLRRS